MNNFAQRRNERNARKEEQESISASFALVAPLREPLIGLAR
jgi:hypothetical protein